MKLRVADLSWQELDEEIVVLDLASSTYLHLNGTGATLWRRLVDGCDRPDLEAALVDHYDVDAQQASADVEAFLADLQTRGLLDTNSG